METWNVRCINSIKKQKEEVAKRCNIQFGQTHLSCARCEKIVSNPIDHVCSDIRLKLLSQSKKSRHKATGASKKA